MPEGSGSPNPQAGNGGDPNAGGANPQAGNGAPAGNPQAGTPESGNPSQPQMSLQDALAALEKTRLENAQHRTENARIAADLKKFQDAQLTDTQKRERDFTDMQTKVFEYEARLQQQALQIAGYRQGVQLGIGDVSAALALVQAEHGSEVKFNAAGEPENLEALFKQVLKDHPVLAAQAQPSGQPRPPSSGGTTNPGRQSGNGGLTMELIKSMTVRERMARMTEIDAWLTANPDLARQWAEQKRS